MELGAEWPGGHWMVLGKPQRLGKIGERLRKRGKERDDLDICKFI